MPVKLREKLELLLVIYYEFVVESEKAQVIFTGNLRRNDLLLKELLPNRQL
jgi:hypothetical protein